MLVSKMKLDLARARVKEEAEAARMAYEHKQKWNLRPIYKAENVWYGSD